MYRGFADSNGNSVFLGIPFAATTGGKNRWREAQDVPKLLPGTIVNATSFGPTCPQAITSQYYSRQDEDCLNLNVWAPRGGKNLPVFVYMYGGAMVTGSSSNPLYQGNNFARKGVVFVSFNTRESIWGAPNSAELKAAHPDASQNFEISDVDKAMEWIHDNIHAFGGNPDHIVFGGQSSGSVQVDHYLWNHPDTWLKGAFQMAANAISGPTYAPLNEGLDVVSAQVGCPTGKGQLDCLRKVSIFDIQTAFFNSTANVFFTPTIDNITRHSDYVSRFHAGKYASHVPLLVGITDDEGALFGSIVYASENTNFSDWINHFNADLGHIPDDVLIAAYNPADYATESDRSGASYGDARFYCPTDYFLDLRSAKQDTWAYRYFAPYNLGDLPTHTPTHESAQVLANHLNDWLIAWIKNPAAGPGWEKASPLSGPLALVGVPDDELSISMGVTGDYNSRCKAVYKPYFPKYPFIRDLRDIVPFEFR
ncbi:Carboxylesterase [Pleurostoma richardsiae]|uniref:Carboxylesterase n=1 Tax=Pleurostoma richardsiae TaxID=41990 RepID=A0AA38VN98_9PEZI|nr:Carboxylesterase [Pleurostoma richardsiae]